MTRKPHTSITRALAPAPSEAEMSQAKEKVWLAVAQRAESRQKLPESLRFPLWRTYAMVGVTAALILSLMGTTGYFYKEQQRLAAEKAQTSPSDTQNSIVFLPEDERYFVPTQITPTPEPTTSGSTPAAQTPPPTPPTGKVKRISLNTSLVNYMSNPTANAVTGVREAGSTVQRPSFIKTAYAADPYPAVYYVDYRKNASAIIELNIYTGKKGEVVSEPGQVITNLDFSSRRQELVYSISTTNTGGGNRTVATYNLNSKKRTVLIEGVDFATPKWSPNGQTIAVPTKSAVHYFTNGKQTTYPKSEMGREYAYYWEHDGKAVCFDMSLSVMISASSYKDSIECIQLDDGTRVTYGPYDHGYAMSDVNQIKDGTVYGLFYGSIESAAGGSTWPSWFFSAQGSTITDYRPETDHTISYGLYRNWLSSKDMDKAVYVNEVRSSSPYKTYLYNFSIQNRSLKAIELTETIYNTSGLRILGWNGNEDNVLLWDQSNRFWNVDLTTSEITLVTQP